MDVPLDEQFLGITVAITVNGGLLDIGDSLSTSGAFIFTGGTIKVVEDETATFE